MFPTLVSHLCCPACRGGLVLRAEHEDGRRVLQGVLECEDCSAFYAIERGVPRLNERMSGLEAVARTFSFEWKAHHEGKLEDDTLFGLTPEEDWEYFCSSAGMRDNDLRGTAVLDAGCGSGRLTRQIGEKGAALVIGMDINEAVDEAFRYCEDLPNVHIVQGNVFAPPVREGQFDLVWSNGVIHHTPDAKEAHRSLTRLVRPGGTLYVWVYAKRFNPFRLTKDVLDAVRVTRLPEPALLFLAKLFSYVSIPLHLAYRGIRSVPGLRPRTAWARRTVRPRTVSELQLTWFDALSPEYDSRHTEAEVILWFRRAGFDRIHAIEEPKVGVRGVAPLRPPQA